MKTKDLNETQPSAIRRFWRLLRGKETGQQPAPDQRVKLESNGQSTTKGNPPKRVLIVDDDQVFLKATALKLKSAGYQPLTASDSADALGIVAEQQPDLVLVDVNLPPDVSNGGMVSWDGFGLVNWLRGMVDTQVTKFAVISGAEGDRYPERAHACGAVGFLRKPLDFERLFQLLKAKPS
jgi:CheY-like chemotaxis protein